MIVNQHIFREYDIRGIVEEDLSPSFVKALGRAFATKALEAGHDQVIIGHDNRSHSPELKGYLTDGILSAGCNVCDIGLVVTPVFYYARELYDIDPGIMITGSHNPKEYNGFKIALGSGTIYGDEIQELRRRIEEEVFASGEGQVRQASPIQAYLEMVEKKIKLGPRKLKVVVDCGNGTAAVAAPDLLRRLGVEVIELYCDSDPDFPNHHPDPVKSENLKDLKKLVLERQADFGVAYDGDADRIGVVDDRGNIIWGDGLMVLYWREILESYPGADCIVEVKCSQALVDELVKLGGKPQFYKTGHSLIKAKMREIGAVFTGEMSGHMFFADEYYGFDDALYATARLARILSNSDEALSEMMATVPKYYSTAETRIPCADHQKKQTVDRLREHFIQHHKVITIDGARVLFPDGWGLVRASNTSPKLVARCEGKTEAALERICREMKAAMVGIGGLDDFQWAW